MKLDYKKDLKNLYMPKQYPLVQEIPAMKFAVIDGMGNPNSSEFSLKVEALYSFSYAVKMSYKSKSVPDGFYDYVVFPLEGVWDLIDKEEAVSNKDNFKYSIMIRQPEFLTDHLFERFINEIKIKKQNPYFDDIKFITDEEGLCCQMMHIGSFDDEPKSFALMEEFCKEKVYQRISKVHREIYLSDPRKTAAEKLKTVLRFKITSPQDYI